MATSNSTGDGSRERVQRRILGRVSRYDLLLATIPAVFGLAVVACLALSVPRQAAAGVGALLGWVVLADALYLNPPTPPSEEP